ncbi:hypothetical protein A2U01_0082946, partial [Trifolium medium]|nr:hypothetical protein [Trifolium medium]
CNPVKLAGRDQATGSDQTSERFSLKRQKATKTLKNPKVPRCSDRQATEACHRRWHRRWAIMLCS